MCQDETTVGSFQYARLNVTAVLKIRQNIGREEVMRINDTFGRPSYLTGMLEVAGGNMNVQLRAFVFTGTVSIRLSKEDKRPLKIWA